MHRLIPAICALLAALPVRAEETELAPERAPRRADASYREIFAGPFVSPRLFAMPVADVVGAYQISLSYDGSLLQEQGVLSSAGVFAIGFGDIAQLEYRHTSAISIERTSAPVPSVGVQLKIPIPERRYVPAFAMAFRLGVPRGETFDGVSVDETVTDLYAVSRLKLWGALRRVTLHAGVRASSAKIEVRGASDREADKLLILPAVGFEVMANDDTRFVGELGLVPAFDLDLETAGAMPEIGQGVQARLGVRWNLLPSFAFDASLGYQIEAANMGGTMSRGAGAVVDWDIRLGGELFIPWGALTCRAVGIFCDDERK
jgi:hypothetical protein